MRLFLSQRERSIRRSEWSPAPAQVPEGERVYAIGDIHGRLDLLKMLVAAIEEEQRLLPPGRPTVVFLGDYVDRGPDSCGVIDWLCERPLPDFERVHLRGNHEEWFEDFLTDISVGPSWLYCGGVATLASYGIRAALGEDNPARLKGLQADLAAALPGSHRAFLRALDHYHEIGRLSLRPCRRQARCAARRAIARRSAVDSRCLSARDCRPRPCRRARPLDFE